MNISHNQKMLAKRFLVNNTLCNNFKNYRYVSNISKISNLYTYLYAHIQYPKKEISNPELKYTDNDQHTNVLEWWKNSNIESKYTNHGQYTNVLEWWKNSNLGLKYTDNGQYVNVLELRKNLDIEPKNTDDGTNSTYKIFFGIVLFLSSIIPVVYSTHKKKDLAITSNEPFKINFKFDGKIRVTRYINGVIYECNFDTVDKVIKFLNRLNFYNDSINNFTYNGEIILNSGEESVKKVRVLLEKIKYFRIVINVNEFDTINSKILTCINVESFRAMNDKYGNRVKRDEVCYDPCVGCGDEYDIHHKHILILKNIYCLSHIEKFVDIIDIDVVDDDFLHNFMSSSKVNIFRVKKLMVDPKKINDIFQKKIYIVANGGRPLSNLNDAINIYLATNGKLRIVDGRSHRRFMDRCNDSTAIVTSLNEIKSLDKNILDQLEKMPKICLHLTNSHGIKLILPDRDIKITSGHYGGNYFITCGRDVTLVMHNIDKTFIEKCLCDLEKINYRSLTIQPQYFDWLGYTVCASDAYEDFGHLFKSVPTYTIQGGDKFMHINNRFKIIAVKIFNFFSGNCGFFNSN